MSINNIRVKVSKKNHGIYRSLITENGLHKKIFEMHGEFFVLCASLGYKRGERCEELDKGKELFWSHHLTAEGEHVLKAIAIASTNNDYSVLEDEKKLIQIVEGFADGGIQILLDELFQSYIKEKEDGLYLQFSDEDYIEKDLLNFIYKEFNKPPL